MSRRVLLVVAPLLALLSFACFGGNDEPEPTPVPTEAPSGSGPAEQALGRHVESTLGKPYLEDCSKADAQRDVGKICSILRGERENMRAYVLGQTFSEGLQWAIVGQSGGGQWNVVLSVPITSDNAGVPGIPWPLRQGADVVVVGAQPCVNVRTGPSIMQAAVDAICDGTRIKIGAGPVDADNHQWWQIDGRSGWVVSDYLRYPDAAQQ